MSLAAFQKRPFASEPSGTWTALSDGIAGAAVVTGSGLATGAGAGGSTAAGGGSDGRGGGEDAHAVSARPAATVAERTSPDPRSDHMCPE